MNVLLCKHLYYMRGLAIIINRETFFIVILFWIIKKIWVTEARRKIGSLYMCDTVTEYVCQKWFNKFHSENFNINDAPRSGRPTKIDSSYVKIIVVANPSQKSAGDLYRVTYFPHKRRKPFEDTFPVSIFGCRNTWRTRIWSILFLFLPASQTEENNVFESNGDGRWKIDCLE